jgi:hypothetical protein
MNGVQRPETGNLNKFLGPAQDQRTHLHQLPVDTIPPDPGQDYGQVAISQLPGAAPATEGGQHLHGPLADVKNR